MMTLEEIKKEVLHYQNELEKPIPLEINECIERMAYLSGIYSRTSYILANAKKNLRIVKNEQLNVHLNRTSEKFLSSKIQNTLLEGLAIEETYFVELLELMNQSCAQQIEICRTIISKEKEEMKLAGITMKS
jgi:hypothetical protein